MHSLIEIANQINKEKLSVFELSVLYNEIPENYKKDLILPFLSIENNMIKISARIKDSEKIKRKELIDEIIGQSVDIYKVSIDDTDVNIYGESTTKYYEVGFRVNCLISFEEPTITFDDFGPDKKSNIEEQKIHKFQITTNYKKCFDSRIKKKKKNFFQNK